VNLPDPLYVPTHKVPQRRAGLVLLCIALIAIVLDATGLSNFPRVSTYLLLAALVVIAIAVHKTEGRLTSLIGLLFMSTVLFNAAEPIYVSLTGDSSIYTISFGTTVEPAGRALFHLLTFWTVGISSLFGGYFLFFTGRTDSRKPLGDSARSFCKRAFIVAFLIAAPLIPIMVRSKLLAFATGGYTALYLGQTQYAFDPTRLLDFLCPLLYSLSVLINEKRYSRMMLVAVLGYALTGIVVGQRMEAGAWLFVMLWHFSTVRRKPLRIVPLALALTLAATLFQIINVLRGGYAAERFILIEYFVGQGITFLLPALSWTLPPPPMHSILGSLLPLGGLYHLLDIGTAANSNVANYICSQSDPVLFGAGYGLGSSWCMEVFYLFGGVMLLFAVGCGLLGFLLRRWEEHSADSHAALFLLCICLSSLFSLPRGSFGTMTFQAIYGTAFLVLIFFTSCVPNIYRSNGTGEEGVHVAN
jgi:O-antigen polysaccharide polymerase Wzy